MSELYVFPYHLEILGGIPLKSTFEVTFAEFPHRISPFLTQSIEPKPGSVKIMQRTNPAWLHQREMQALSSPSFVRRSHHQPQGQF